MLSLGQKLKMTKTCKKRFFKNVTVVPCKKPLQKIPNIREIRQFLKSAILQSLGKMLNLGQKFKMPKTLKKRFFKNVTVVFCKNPLQKIPNIREIRQFLKSAILQSLGKMLNLGQKFKMPKTLKKRFFKNVTVVFCKNPLQKIPNIREIRQF